RDRPSNCGLPLGWRAHRLRALHRCAHDGGGPLWIVRTSARGGTAMSDRVSYVVDPLFSLLIPGLGQLRQRKFILASVLFLLGLACWYVTPVLGLPVNIAAATLAALPSIRRL